MATLALSFRNVAPVNMPYVSGMLSALVSAKLHVNYLMGTSRRWTFNNHLFFFVLVRTQSALNELTLCIDRLENIDDGNQWDQTENLKITMNFSETDELTANDLPRIKKATITPISCWIEDYEKKSTTEVIEPVKEFVIVYRDGRKIGFTEGLYPELPWSIYQKSNKDHTTISIYFSQFVDIRQIDYLLYEGKKIPIG